MKRPNVILVLVDDMGFSDLGITGSEIRTPNIDQLANDGALLTSMYNCARCCPTRASLLTGLYPHNAGVGHMGANLGSAAYQGYLGNDTATIAEVLRASGYRTLMCGKWHVGGEFTARDDDDWCAKDLHRAGPRQRGFDRFYGLLEGATHYYSPTTIMEDDKRVEIDPDDFYFTDAITDKAIEMLSQTEGSDQPYFLYLAHIAPHWPLHAPAEDVARYEGFYNDGWDAARCARHETLNGSGVLPANWDISPRDSEVCPWTSVKLKNWEASRMAAYAGMIDRLDQSVGRLLRALKRLGQYDDTLILFLSDNGGCAEFMAEDGWAQYYPDTTLDGRKIKMGNVPGVAPGNAQTFQSYDRAWANVSNSPFRLFKHYVHEGGISTPLIAHWPKKISPGLRAHAACHVVDVLPTILQVTGSQYVSELGGHEIQPLHGESFVDLLEGNSWQREQPIFFEHEGNSAIRVNNFKLVRKYNCDWELYDMDTDRTELHNRVGVNQPLETDMLLQYRDWADKTGVLDWRLLLPQLLSAWNLETSDG